MEMEMKMKEGADRSEVYDVTDFFFVFALDPIVGETRYRIH